MPWWHSRWQFGQSAATLVSPSAAALAPHLRTARFINSHKKPDAVSWAARRDLAGHISPPVPAHHIEAADIVLGIGSPFAHGCVASEQQSRAGSNGSGGQTKERSDVCFRLSQSQRIYCFVNVNPTGGPPLTGATLSTTRSPFRWMRNTMRTL